MVVQCSHALGNVRQEGGNIIVFRHCLGGAACSTRTSCTDASCLLLVSFQTVVVVVTVVEIAVAVTRAALLLHAVKVGFGISILGRMGTRRKPFAPCFDSGS